MSNDPEQPIGDGAHEAGYGKPPPRNRFKRGQSGNPKGRPAKPKAIHPKHVFASEPTARALQVEADRVISLVVNNRRTKMTVREAAIRTLGTNAINATGSPRSSFSTN